MVRPPNLLCALLLGLTKEIELKKNLGVRLTIPRTFLLFSTLGYMLSTVAELKVRQPSLILLQAPSYPMLFLVKFLQGGVGRVFFIFNVLFATVYSYMLYLTSVYNSRLENASRTFERSFAENEAKRHTISASALSTWIVVSFATAVVWVKEGLASFKGSVFKYVPCLTPPPPLGHQF